MGQFIKLPSAETGKPIPLSGLVEPTIPVPEEVQKENALKYHFTLGINSPGYDSLMKSVAAGQDTQIQQIIADQENLKDQQARNAILQEVADQSKDKVIAPEVYDFIQGLSPAELHDPELRYVKAYANAVLNVPGPEYDFQQVFSTPESEENFFAQSRGAADHIAFNEIVYQRMNKLQAKWDAKGIIGKGYEYVEQWGVPFASYFNQRNTIDGPAVGSILQGNNKREQYQRLHSLPLAERARVFNAAIDEIAEDNLLDAIHFAQGAYAYTHDEEQMEDFFTGLEVATTLPLTKSGKILGVIKGNTKSAEEVMAVAERVTAEGGEAPAKTASARQPALSKVKAPRPITSKHRRAEQLEEYRKRGVIDVSDMDETQLQAFMKEVKGIDVAALSEEELADLNRQMAGTSIRQATLKAPRPIKAPTPLTAQSQHFKDIAEAAKSDNPNIVADVIAASGNTAKAATHKALKLNAIKRQKQPPETLKGRAERDSFVPSMFDPQAATKAKVPFTKLTSQASVRINEALAKVQFTLDEAIEKSGNIVSRYPTEQALEEAWKVAQKDFEKLYPSVNDAVVDVHFGRPETTQANTAYIVTHIGRPDKTFFKEVSHAHYAAKNHYNLLKDGYEVVPRGNGYLIQIGTYADDLKIKDFLVNTDDPTPSSVANTFFGYFRTSDDLVNQLSREQRKRITHAYSLLQNNVKTAAKAISDISRVPGRMARFEKVLRASMHHKVPRTVEWRNRQTGAIEQKQTEKVGLNYTREQFELKYHELNGRPASEKEVLAYETYKKLLDFDYVVRNLDLTRDKVRLGIQEFQFQAWQAVDESGQKVKKDTPLFDGSLRDELPYGHPKESIVGIYSDADGFPHIYDVNSMSANNKEFVKKLIDEDGYRIIEIANPDAKPLRDFFESEEGINFAIVKAPKTRVLGLTQIPKTEGGHRIPKHPVFMKAPRVSKPSRKYRDTEGNVREEELDRHYYEGDITLYGVHSEAKAREILPHMHKARDLFLAGDKNAFVEYVAKHIPRDPERFWADFEEKVIPTNVDYYVVKSGQGVNDIPEFKKGLQSRFPGMVDTIDSPFNKYRLINKKFAGQKNPDLFSWRTEGYDESNPVVKLESAKYIDPVEAMQSSMASLMRNRAYSDYIYSSVESWVEEFGPLLKTDQRELRANPLHFLHNPEWVDKPTDRELFAAAQNSRRAILQLLGTRSELRNNVEWIKGKIVDQAYRAIGDTKSEKLADALLPTSNDPLAYVRGAAFHMKLGLLNPIQMWTQSQTLFHMTAITGNPVRAGRSFVGATYMQMLQNTTNPKIIDHVASLAAKSGFGTAEEFKEAYYALKETGLWFVEGEHGWRNDVLDPKMFQGAIGTALDKGTVFFKGTERFVRLAAWNIAFREFKEGKGAFKAKGTMIDTQSINKILARQDILSGNMTNASAAAIQRGVFSLTTQFFGYQFRILDQVLGKRLTVPERLRVIAMYSAVYGVPIGAGAGVLTPWYSDIKDYAQTDLGIDTSEGAWQAFFDGALSFITEGITGDPYNPGKRFGPGGFELIKTVFDEGPSEDTLLAILGASASIFGDAVKWAFPAVTTLWSQVWDDEADQVPLQPQEFIDAFRSISTVNNSVKAHLAYYAHAYYTRDGQKIADATTTDAIMTAFFGLTNSHIERMYQQMEELREDKATLDILKSEYIKAKRQALRATTEEDRRKFLRKARIYLKSANLTTREASRWFSQAGRGNEELILKMDREYRERFQKKLKGE